MYNKLHRMAFYANRERLYSTVYGSLGIGVSNPLASLTVQNNASFGMNVPAPCNTVIIGGKLGVGVSNPHDTLTVNGSVYVSSNLKVEGNFKVDNLVTSSITLSNSSGIAVLEQSNNNIGVNTTNPQYMFDVKGSIQALGYCNLILNSLSSTSVHQAAAAAAVKTTFDTASWTSNNAFIKNTDGSLSLSNVTSASGIRLYTQSNFLGVSKSNPRTALDVAGDINFSGTLYQNMTMFASSRWSSNMTGSNIYFTRGRVCVGTSNFEELFTVAGGNAKFTSNVVVQQRLGINIATTSNPQANLDVVGTVRINSNTSNVALYVIGNTRFDGNMEINGSLTTVNTDVRITDAFTVSNEGTTTALKVYQTGPQDIAEFYDDATLVLKVHNMGMVSIGSNGNATERFQVNNGNAKFTSNIYVAERMGINTSNPGASLDISGDVRITSFTSNVALNVFGKSSFLGKVDISSDASFGGWITANGYSNLVIDSFSNISTSNAPSCAALKKVYDSYTATSNTVYFGSNDIYSSLVAVSNIAFTQSNNTYPLLFAVSNNVYFSSNDIYTRIVTISNVAFTESNDSYPRLFAVSNNTYFSSNDIYPRLLAVSNVTFGLVSPWTTNGSNLYITTSNVGIGTSNPTYTLDIAGNMNVSGNLLKYGKDVTSIYRTFDSNIAIPPFNVTGGTALSNGYIFTSPAGYTSGAANLYDNNSNTYTNHDNGGGYFEGNGVYIGNASTTNGISGAWTQIQCPFEFTLRAYALAFNDTIYVPKEWYVFGSKDGITWTMIDRRTYVWNMPAKTLGVMNLDPIPIPYSYYRLVFNKSANISTISPTTLIWYPLTEKYYNQGSNAPLGLGTSNPASLLHIDGNNGNYVLHTSSSNIDGLMVGLEGMNVGGSGATGVVWNKANAALAFGTSNIERVRITSNGFMGVNTILPTEYLHTAGKIYSTMQFLSPSNDSVSMPSYSFKEDSNTGMFHPSNDTIGFSTNGNERVRIGDQGFVGIGTAALRSMLTITSNAPVNSDVAVLSLRNTGGGNTLARTSIDFFTSNLTAASNAQLRLSAYDSNFSAGFLVASKVPGAESNTLATTMFLSPDGNLVLGGGMSSVFQGTTYKLFTSGSNYLGGNTLINGTLQANGSITAFDTSAFSDVRLKRNIQGIENASTVISQLNGYLYEWNSNAEYIYKNVVQRDGNKEIGFIAQEVQRVLPEIVKPSVMGETEYLTINYSKIIPYLVEAFKEERKKNKMHRMAIEIRGNQVILNLDDTGIKWMNVQVIVSAIDVLGFGRADYDSNTNQVLINVSVDGCYNVLIIGDEI